jgi:hypothetical protein
MAEPNLCPWFLQRALPQIRDLEAFSGSLHPDVNTFDLQDINKYVFLFLWALVSKVLELLVSIPATSLIDT